MLIEKWKDDEVVVGIINKLGFIVFWVECVGKDIVLV